MTENLSGSQASVAAARRAPVSLAALGVLAAVAIVLRFWNLGGAGISSDGAGACACAALAPEAFDSGEYPALRVAPLVPWILRASFAWWGPVDTLAIAAIALLGVATVVASYFAGRRWVGDHAALAGAATLAAMQMHVAYSRQVGTEIPFTFLLLIAAWASAAALERRSFLPAAAAGLAAIGAALAAPRGAFDATAIAPWDAVRLLVRSAWAWISPLALAPALLGFVVMARRRSRVDALLLGWIGLFLILGSFARPDPARLVPVLPPLALAAGIGIDELARILAPLWTRGRGLCISILMLVPGAGSTFRTLSLEDHGYVLAARYLAQSAPDPRPDVLVAQRALLFYLANSDLRAHPFLDGGDPRAIAALEAGEFRNLVGDLRLLRSPAVRGFLEERSGGLNLVAVIGNPLPETTIVAAGGFEALDSLRSASASPEDRATLSTIRVWRSSLPRRH